MDKKEKYYNYVVNDLVKKTEIDYDEEEVSVPSTSFLVQYFPYFFLSPSPSLFYFAKHCEEVYGLTDKEIFYVWDRYRKIIKDKIRNNG